MTNTGQMLITTGPSALRAGRDFDVQTWLDNQQALVGIRISELQTEADTNRLAALESERTFTERTFARGLRVLAGSALIRAGRALAQEPASRHARINRPHATA